MEGGRAGGWVGGQTECRLNENTVRQNTPLLILSHHESHDMIYVREQIVFTLVSRGRSCSVRLAKILASPLVGFWF